MPENGNGSAAPQQQVGQSPAAKPQGVIGAGRCTGNCMNCTIFQRALCSSQVGYYNMKMMEQLMQRTAALEQGIKVLAEKLDAMQGSEETLINPTIAQQGGGAGQ